MSGVVQFNSVVSYNFIPFISFISMFVAQIYDPSVTTNSIFLLFSCRLWSNIPANRFWILTLIATFVGLQKKVEWIQGLTILFLRIFWRFNHLTKLFYDYSITWGFWNTSKNISKIRPIFCMFLRNKPEKYTSKALKSLMHKNQNLTQSLLVNEPLLSVTYPWFWSGRALTQVRVGFIKVNTTTPRKIML